MRKVMLTIVTFALGIGVGLWTGGRGTVGARDKVHRPRTASRPFPLHLGHKT